MAINGITGKLLAAAIEVKASTRGAMQSMHLFLEEKKANRSIRFSLENFGQMQQIAIYPLYAVQNALRQG